MKNLLLITVIFTGLLMMNVHAQLPPNVVREDFEDDEATSTAAGRYNVITGVNPDEDWYLFEHTISNCDSGNWARMHVATPGGMTVGGDSLPWDTNVLVAGANSPGFAGCTQNIYSLYNDEEKAVPEFEIRFGLGHVNNADEGSGMWIWGEGGFITQFCQDSNGHFYLTNYEFSSRDCRSADGTASFGSIFQHTVVVDLNWKIDWTNQTVTVTIVDIVHKEPDEAGTLAAGVSRTIAFDNPSTVFHRIQVWTRGEFGDSGAVTYIDNYVVKDLVITEGTGNVTVPSEFDTGIVSFAQELGFKTPQSQQLFALFLIGTSTLIASLFSRFASEGKFKNYLIHGTSVVVGAFCVYTGMIQLWMTIVSIVISSVIIKGTSTIINTYKSGGFFNPDTPTKNEEFVPGITTNIGEFGPEGTGPEAAQERQRRIDEQVKQELREKRQAEESA